MPKRGFITGSSRGLGRAIVEAALTAGDRVLASAGTQGLSNRCLSASAKSFGLQRST